MDLNRRRVRVTALSRPCPLPAQAGRDSATEPRQSWGGPVKRLIFSLLGKDPQAVVVSFWTGADALVLKMIEEIRGLVPDRQHYVVAIGPGPKPEGCMKIELKPGDLYLQLRRVFRHKRIGLAPVLFTS